MLHATHAKSLAEKPARLLEPLDRWIKIINGDFSCSGVNLNHSHSSFDMFSENQ